MCDFLHDASSARSRNRMRQALAKVVPSRLALTRVSRASLRLHFIWFHSVFFILLFFDYSGFSIETGH